MASVRRVNCVGLVISWKKLYHGVSPQQWSVTIPSLRDIARVIKAGKLHQADNLLKKMVSAGIYPNVVTFNTIMDGFCKDGNSSAAMRFLDEMKRQDLSPNVVVITH
ncbi:hypothetical protein HPP92_007962 [Vanilla planifolia]|uniref:Pentatricopeptide repeat-containing protein n=1 Tax=Vanilla planifolia TaxID=51239 RepID=A0A835RL70_VANPL|nr:hypothetical protein HPP92_007962 [Vanilla planifolia]